MIFDIPNAHRLWIYKNSPGPFCIVFYEENNPKNKEFYFLLKEILKNFKHIPFLRIEYSDFKRNFPSEKVTSANQILIIEKKKESRIENTDDYQKIPEILKNVSDIISEKRTLRNAEFRKKKKFRIWAPNGHSLKISEISQIDHQNPDSLYEFPNISSNLGKLRFFKKRMKKTQILQSHIKSETILKLKNKLSLKLAKNKETSSVSSLPPHFNSNQTFLPIKRVKTSFFSNINDSEKLEKPLDLGISKESLKINHSSLKIDEPLDLSIS